MNQLAAVLAGALLAGVMGVRTWAEEGSMRFIANGQIRVGVNLDIGGAITHVSELPDGPNLINSADWGRQIQMSFYGGPADYRREGKRKSEHWGGFPWNPIQSGDCFGNGSKTLDCQAEGSTIHVSSIPMLWPMENDPGECLFETWIELDGKTFRYRGRLTNKRTDTTPYGAHHQEVPAVYSNGVWHRLMTYVGDRPFEHGELTEVRKTVREPWPWSKWLAAENWSALVNDAGRGIGAWHPGVFEFHGGFAGRRGQGGPKDGPTGYFAPMRTDILDHNIVYDYTCVFIVGTLEEIRDTVYRHAARNVIPAWIFARDRQHWSFRDARDGGWPIAGAWQIFLDTRQARIESPLEYWRAEAAPRLRLRAAFHTRGAEARIFWRTFSPAVHTTASWQEWARTWWAPERSLTFPLTHDGQMREIVVDLASSAEYRGALSGLAIDLPQSADGDTVRIESIALEAAR
ncbi:MAG: hypothetical protein JXR77_02790 [Lentisphaeria bacterium]|nr:hypothetical protein [Lentisphaeria bacterium]